MKLFASMWHKAKWMGLPMRLELIHVGLLVKLASHYTTKSCWVFFFRDQINEWPFKLPSQELQ